MTFDYPYMLGAFVIFIFIFLLDFFSAFRKYRQKLPEELRKKLLISSLFFNIFLAFAIIALSGPRWGTGYSVPEYRRGLDVVFAVDVSRSMDVRDTQTLPAMTRLEHGLSIAKESMLNITGARFAAVIGRSRGYLAVPLSYDSYAVYNFLESIDVSSVTGRSTNLESLVETAAFSFQNTSPAQKVIVLISDGESHSGVMRNALNYCSANGIIVTAVAAGSNEGGLVPLGTMPTGAVLDGTAPSAMNDPLSEIISKRDTIAMLTAADRTGGIYIDANRADAASVLSSHLLSISRESKNRTGQTESKQRRVLFIILSLLAYGACKFVPRLSTGKFLSLKNKFYKKVSFTSMILIVLFLSSCSKGKMLILEANYLVSVSQYDSAVIPYLKALQYDDAAPYAEYGLGLILYSYDESSAALKYYENSSKILETLPANEHRELRYRNYYNSGIIYFEEGDFSAAADAFKEALRTDPGKLSAKRNLELSLMSITMETPKENAGESRNESREILFDYIKQHEQQIWKSREWTTEEKFSGPDY